MSENCGLKNPLGICKTVLRLEGALNDGGLAVVVSNDMAEYAAVKRAARNIEPGPMHDYRVCDFSKERAFWMALKNCDNKVVGLQAYRFDNIDVSLAEWCGNYMIGVYMRRDELMVPSHIKPPAGSISERLRGKLVYHGEVWMDKSIKSKDAVADFSVMGALLAMLKWDFDAMWALTSQSIASRGYPGRMGYPFIERGFLRWLWHSDGVEPVEYLTVAERLHIEQFVDEPVTNQANPNGVLAKLGASSNHLEADLSKL
ncbi:MAG: hypothetical protein KGO53_06180 [Alphaproteobacteria bacterium]|nr:hypothetical protein [Alphaproteobacteria bacterium]